MMTVLLQWCVTIPSKLGRSWHCQLSSVYNITVFHPAAELGMVQLSRVYGLTGSTLVPRPKFRMMDGMVQLSGVYSLTDSSLFPRPKFSMMDGSHLRWETVVPQCVTILGKLGRSMHCPVYRS
jgi:hypothetical protein